MGNHTHTFNFGSEDSISVQQLLSLVQRYGALPPIEYCNSPPKETQHLSLDTQKSKELLGWTSKLQPEQAVRWTIEEYSESRGPEALLGLMLSRFRFLEG